MCIDWINVGKQLVDLEENNIDFSELCITSSVRVEESDIEEVVVETTKAEGNKCPVCWKINKEKCERHSS